MENNPNNSTIEDILLEIENSELVFEEPKPIKKTIAQSLTPTFENVTREFINRTMKKILLGEGKIKFNFIFTQPEALDFIEHTLTKTIVAYFPRTFAIGNSLKLDDVEVAENVGDYKEYLDDAKTIMNVLKNTNQSHNNLPSLIIKDYELFFELLRQCYEKTIDLFYERTELSGFFVYEMENLFEELWLRATPEDFDNPIEFLKTQVQLINDETLHQYKKETVLGELQLFDNNPIGIKTNIARTWDEAPFKLEIGIYDKRYCDNKELFIRPHYSLPTIRYSFYEKNNKKICVIGSIQKEPYSKMDPEHIKKMFERQKYKIFRGLTEVNCFEVEPSKLISLIIFIILLNKKGISEIEIPGLYSLDYQYHERRNINLKTEFEKKWTKHQIETSPQIYEEDLKWLENNLNKEDTISKNKTENLINLILFLQNYFPGLIINTYPGEVDNLLRISVPLINDETEINGDLAKELYILIDEFDKEDNLKR